MTALPVLAVGILMKFVAVLFVIVSVVLILVILVQKGRGGGLSGAFGGGMASGLLGSKTGDFLTWVTIGLVTVFLGLAILMARYYRPSVEFGTEPPVAPPSQSTPASSQQPVPSTSAPSTTGQPAPTDQVPAAQPAQPNAAGAEAGPTGGQ